MGVDNRTLITQRVAALDGVVVWPSMYRPGNAFWVNGKEIAHFEDPDVIEIRLTRAEIREMRAQLRADDRVELRRSGADWIDVHCRSADDVAFVVELCEHAVAAHLPAPGKVTQPPPTGAELERRRRFH